MAPNGRVIPFGGGRGDGAGGAELPARRFLLVVPSIGGAAEPAAGLAIPPGLLEAIPPDAVAVGDSGLVAAFAATFAMLERIRLEQRALVARLEAAGLLPPEPPAV